MSLSIVRVLALGEGSAGFARSRVRGFCMYVNVAFLIRAMLRKRMRMLVIVCGLVIVSGLAIVWGLVMKVCSVLEDRM